MSGSIGSVVHNSFSFVDNSSFPEWCDSNEMVKTRFGSAKSGYLLATSGSGVEALGRGGVWEG